MAIFSSYILISSLSLLHITLGYFLHTSPTTVAEQGMVLVLSNAFQLPISSAFTVPSHVLTLLACVFVLVGLTDLTSANLPTEVGTLFWSSQAPVRVAFFFILTTWGWFGGPKGAAFFSAGGAGSASAPPGYIPRNFAFGPVSDGVIFAWAFFESLMWFWIYITIRDEIREVRVRRAERA